MTYDFSLFDRPGLNGRMGGRRRLPHPSSSATLLSTLVKRPQLVTYSEFLEKFDQEIPIMNGSHQQPPGLSTPTGKGYGFAPFNPFGAGPSRAHNDTYEDLHSPASFVESGWIKDVFQDQWIGNGKIEEVNEDVVDLSSNGVGDNHTTPRAKSTARLSLASGDNDANDFEQDIIPLNSTPPACPRSRKLPSLRESIIGSEYNSFRATSSNDLAMALSTNASPSSAVLDDQHEVALVKENLSLLVSCTEDVKEMETYFLEKVMELDLSQHVDICSRLQESLRSLHNTLTHRARMGAEEWQVRSASWHQKYSKRILSLRTTLLRLSGVHRQMETHPLRPRQRLAILTKLEQHEAKLADLASKYTVAFDRLRLRHLHFLLTQSHMKAKYQKSHRMSRASFEREWRDGKMLRAALRHEFHDLRQEFYNSPRKGRNTSAP